MRTSWFVLLVVAATVFPGLASAQTEWIEHPDNPVVPAPNPDDWDALRKAVSVIVVDGTYHMFYTGGIPEGPLGSDFQIGHATSADGVEWTMDPANPLLTPGDDGEWNSVDVGFPAVLHDESGFRMWFTGCDESSCGVGYATSADGSAWTEHAGNPILDQGPAGSFDDEGIWPGTVILDGDLYRMWYTGSRAGGGLDWRIGYAESTDGLSWTRHPDPVIDPDIGWDGWLAYSPSVVPDGSVYRMWYAGASGNSFSIGYAESRDGLNWTRSFDNPIFGGDIATDFQTVRWDESSQTFEMWFLDLADSSYRLATSDCCTMTHALFVPAAALASGAEGSFYQTDLDLNNADGVAVEYQLRWLPRGEDCSEPVTSETFTLDPGMSVRYANVLSEVFGLEPDALGALMVVATSPDLLAMSRTYNIPEGKSAGTFGQSMPALVQNDFIESGERRRILFAGEDEGLRFNVGCQNGGDGTMVVNLELFDHEGTSLEQTMMILRPWGNDQLNRVFQDYTPVHGYVDVWTTQSGRRFTCYGSAVDNVTSDPTTIPPS